MCGILAVKSNVVTIQNKEYIYNLIAESQIRGKHATGISYTYQGNIKTIIEPMNSREFLNKHWLEIDQDLTQESKINLVAHTRYSTSDLEYNQPIFNEEGSLVLNGVITQSDPSEWKSRYDEDCVGRNDTEILFNKIQKLVNPLTVIDTTNGHYGSMALAYLYKSGDIVVARNGHRPAWYLNHEGISIVSSTRDIIKRAVGQDVIPNQLELGNLYLLEKDDLKLIVRTQLLDHQLEDWQL